LQKYKKLKKNYSLTTHYITYKQYDFREIIQHFLINKLLGNHEKYQRAAYIIVCYFNNEKILDFDNFDKMFEVGMPFQVVRVAYMQKNKRD